MFLREYELRWNDIDANMHLANSSYLMLFAQTRMAFLESLGFTLSEMAKRRIGPVVFHESIIYFKEVMYGKPVKVSLEVKGLSEGGKFFSFEHNLYDAKGRNCARSPIMGGWISLETRKLIDLPDDLLDTLRDIAKADDYKVLTSADTRAHQQAPKDLILNSTES